jgi:hypothetical protein
VAILGLRQAFGERILTIKYRNISDSPRSNTVGTNSAGFLGVSPVSVHPSKMSASHVSLTRATWPARYTITLHNLLHSDSYEEPCYVIFASLLLLSYLTCFKSFSSAPCSKEEPG